MLPGLIPGLNPGLAASLPGLSGSRPAGSLGGGLLQPPLGSLLRPPLGSGLGGGLGGGLGSGLGGGVGGGLGGGLMSLRSRPPGSLLGNIPSVASSTAKSSMPKFPGVLAPTLVPGAAPTAPPPDPPPPTAQPCTVYVGRISTEVSDDFVRQLLERCGKISKWNRAADPNTSKLTSFGFCDFEDPQGVWRALEFLHEKQLCDKRLLVKCEEKAKQTILNWKESRREELGQKRLEASKEAAKAAEAVKGEEAKQNLDAGKDNGETGEEKLQEEEKKEEKKELLRAPAGPLTDAELDDELRKESQEVEDAVAKLLKEKNRGYPEVKLETVIEEKEDEKLKASQEEKTETLKEKSADNKENKISAGNERKTEDAEDRGKDRQRSPRLTREEERKRRFEEEKRAPVSRHYRQSRRERDREIRAKDRERDIEKEYQYRIREFERSEENRIKALKRDLRELEMQTEPSEREKRKWIERDVNFGKDPGDEREWKRHREDKMKDRQREMEKDAADRAMEQKEAEEERKRKEEEEKRKRKEAEEAKRKARQEEEERRRRQEEEERRIREEEMRKEQEERRKQEEEERMRREAEQKKVQEAAAAKLVRTVQQEMIKKMGEVKIAVAGKGGAGGVVPTGPLAALFNAGQDDLDERGQPRKHRPLTRLDGPPPGETKLRDDEMKRLIQQVPTDKGKAFTYEIDWQSVNEHNIIEKKLRPWVKKKVTEYIGAEEQGMVEFIMRKVTSHAPPETILAELDGFLDEEAENFTLKMWRMLIFEVLRVKAR